MISKIEFTHKNQKEIWIVDHNLNAYGMDISAAFDNYIARATDISSKDFCKYVISKDYNLRCSVKATKR
jgi:hypothetical protein